MRDESSLAEKVFRPFTEEKFRSFVRDGHRLIVVVVVAFDGRLLELGGDAPAAAVGLEVVRQAGSDADLTRRRKVVNTEGGRLAGGGRRRGATVDVVMAATVNDERGQYFGLSHSRGKIFGLGRSRD